jgi:tetratricopeptide (TPR) repeat protein
LNLELGDLAGARAELQRAADLHDDPLAVRLALAHLWLADAMPTRVLEELHADHFTGRGELTEARVLLLRGQALASLGSVAEALASFRAALDKAPDLVDAQLGVAAVYLNEGRDLEARAALDEILRADSTNHRAWGLVGDLERKTGRLAEAEYAYGNAIQGSPAPHDLLMQRAVVRFARDDLSAMEQDLAALRRLGAGAPGTRYVEGLLHYGRGDFGQAQTAFEGSLIAEPEFSASVLLLGATHLAQRNWAQAESNLRRFLTQHPDSDEALRMLAVARLGQGDAVEAQRLLGTMLRPIPVGLRTLEASVRDQIAAGQTEEVLSALRALAESAPADPRVFHRIGRMMDQAGSPDDARTQYRRALELEPAYTPALLSLATLELREGFHDRALGLLNDRLAQNPEENDVRFALAETLIAIKDFAGAIQEYERLVSIRPESVLALNNLAFLYMMVGDPRALEYAERAYLLRPNDPAVADTLGWVLLNLGDVERALPLLETAFRGLPDQPAVRYHYAAALAKAGQPGRARTELEALLEEEALFDKRSAAQRLLETLP